jgi:hypothetical protein
MGPLFSKCKKHLALRCIAGQRFPGLNGKSTIHVGFSSKPSLIARGDLQATSDLKSRQTSGSIPAIPMTTSISVIISSGFIRFQSHIFGKNQWINGKIPELRIHEEYLA